NSGLAGDGSGDSSDDGCPLLSPPNPDRDGSRLPSSKPSPLPSIPNPLIFPGCDGCDGFPPTQSAWGLRVIRILRVRALRSNAISIPTLRRKVAGRRSPRPSASADAGQFLDLAARSPATPSRATRSSEAVPTHSSWVAISALIADAIASASS